MPLAFSTLQLVLLVTGPETLHDPWPWKLPKVVHCALAVVADETEQDPPLLPTEEQVAEPLLSAKGGLLIALHWLPMAPVESDETEQVPPPE